MADSPTQNYGYNLSETVKNGERVSVQRLGAFELRELKDKKIKNPRTGEKMRIPVRRKVVFTPNRQCLSVCLSNLQSIQVETKYIE